MRCRPCRTRVAPSASSPSTRSSAAWSAIAAPAPPPRVNLLAGRTVPSLAIRRNGVRRPRRETSSSTAAASSRSSNVAPSSARAGEQRCASPDVRLRIPTRSGRCSAASAAPPARDLAAQSLRRRRRPRHRWHRHHWHRHHWHHHRWHHHHWHHHRPRRRTRRRWHRHPTPPSVAPPSEPPSDPPSLAAPPAAPPTPPARPPTAPASAPPSAPRSASPLVMSSSSIPHLLTARRPPWPRRGLATRGPARLTGR